MNEVRCTGLMQPHLQKSKICLHKHAAPSCVGLLPALATNAVGSVYSLDWTTGLMNAVVSSLYIFVPMMPLKQIKTL